MNPRAAWILLLVACGGAGLVALCAGPAGWRPPWHPHDAVLALRAPRVVLAGVVGAALAVAGVAMQALLHNALADPYVLGLSGGASSAAVAALTFWPAVPPGAAAALGAAAAAALVRTLVRGVYEPTRLLLAGVALGAVLASITGLVLTIAPADRLVRAALFWLFGGLGTPRWQAVVLPALLLGGAGGWLWRRAERLDRLTLGDDVADALGGHLRQTRREAFVAAVVLTAASVAVSGLIGFVGLIAPHVARRWVGAVHRRVLPVAALVGACVVVSADAIARTAFAPREVPVGLLTALVGGPFFLCQLQQRGGLR